MTVGNFGIGTFSQSGGNVVTNYLALGAYGNSSGTYTLGSGLLYVIPGAEYIGQYGNGVFTQSSGTNTGDNDLILARAAAVYTT